MLQNSLFQAEEIEKEKSVVIEELNLYEDTPARKIGDVYESLLYGDTPMGWDVGGRKDVIRKLNRQDFISYMGSLYSAGNITVIVAGGIAPEKTTALVEKNFGKMKSFDIKGYTKVVEKQSKPKVLIKKKTTEQVHIALGVRTIPINHKDKYPLEVLSAILGAGMSSRLFHEVREKRGLAYYVRTASDHYRDAGTLVSTAGVDPKRVDEAVSVIVAQYGKIRSEKDGIEKKEIDKAKEFIKGHLVLEIEDSRAVAGFYAVQEMLEENIENPTEFIKKIDKVTADEVFITAKRYLIESTLNLAVIGNFDDGQRFEKLLQL